MSLDCYSNSPLFRLRGRWHWLMQATQQKLRGGGVIPLLRFWIVLLWRTCVPESDSFSVFICRHSLVSTFLPISSTPLATTLIFLYFVCKYTDMWFADNSWVGIVSFESQYLSGLNIWAVYGTTWRILWMLRCNLSKSWSTLKN